MEKICRVCEGTKPLSEFYSNAGNTDGKRGECRECSNTINASWAKANYEKQKEYNKGWRRENKDKVREYNRRALLKRLGTARERYHIVKRHCRRYGRPFTWDKADFIDWYDNQAKVCHYCGIALGLQTKQLGNQLDNLTLDRRNAGKEYSRENVVLACRRCNSVKSSWLTDNQMLEIADKYF